MLSQQDMLEAERHGRQVRSIYVYEAPVRLWHWINALAVVVLAVSGYFIGKPLPTMPGEASDNFLMGYIRFAHFAAAYIFAVGLLGRVYWAFVGNHHARQIFKLPISNGQWWSEVFFELRWYLFLEKYPKKYVGHNPMAQLMMFCAILVNKCNLGDCPSLNGKKIAEGNSVNAVSGDQLRIPLQAELWVKFLDGTVGYFSNKSQTPWTLTMRGGHFSSTQQWEYTENAISIQSIAEKGIEKAADEISDKAMEAGLQLLLKKSASVSPGLIVQMMEFMGASKAGSDVVAIKLRSKVEVSIYRNGTYRIRNLEGSPEIWQKNSKPLLLPVGQQVFIDKKGIAGQPVSITDKLIAPEKTVSTQWAGTWQTKWGKMTITQNGNSITGTYEHDKGKISGTINGNKLSGNWSEAPATCHPVMQANLNSPFQQMEKVLPVAGVMVTTVPGKPAGTVIADILFLQSENILHRITGVHPNYPIPN